MAEQAYVRVESPSFIGHKGRVFYIDEEGTETEISGVVSEVHFHMNVHELNKAELHIVKVRLDATAGEFSFIEAQLPVSAKISLEE